jgi:hypothetical protein
MLFGNTVMELAESEELCACIEPTMIAVHKEVNRRRSEKDPDAPRAYLQDMKVVGAVWNDLVESQVFAIQCGKLGTVGFATEYPDKPPDGYVDEQDMLDVNNPSVPKPRPLTDTDRQRIAAVNITTLVRIRDERSAAEREAARQTARLKDLEVRSRYAKRMTVLEREPPPLLFIQGRTVYDFYREQDMYIESIESGRAILTGQEDSNGTLTY